MDLQEFVTKSLSQIAAGVVASHAGIMTTGAQMTGGGTVIKFDVAVTTTDGTKAGGEGGIKVAGFQLGGHAASERSDSTVSRIQFDVRMTLPGSPGAPHAFSIEQL